MKEFIRTTLLIISSTLAVQVNTYLVSQKINALLAIMIATIFAVVSNRILFLCLTELPMLSRSLRPFIDPRARAEGIWIETIENLEDHKYSLIFISYNENSKSFYMQGNNFNSLGEEKGSWSSLLVDIDVKRDKIIFPYIGTHQRLESQTVFGFGIADLYRDGGIKYTRARGQFVDAEKNTSAYKFAMERLEISDLENLSGTKRPYKLEHFVKLIKSYRKIHSETNNHNHQTAEAREES